MQEPESEIFLVLRRRELDGEGEVSGTCMRKGIGQWKRRGDFEAIDEKVFARVALYFAAAMGVGMETPLRKINALHASVRVSCLCASLLRLCKCARPMYLYKCARLSCVFYVACRVSVCGRVFYVCYTSLHTQPQPHSHMRANLRMHLSQRPLRQALAFGCGLFGAWLEQWLA